MTVEQVGLQTLGAPSVVEQVYQRSVLPIIIPLLLRGINVIAVNLRDQAFTCLELLQVVISVAIMTFSIKLVVLVTLSK